MNRHFDVTGGIRGGSWLEAASWIAVIIFCLGWTFWPTSRAVVAAFAMTPISRQPLVTGAESVRLEVQRAIQKHFLNFGVYIPLEDIVFLERLTQTNQSLEGILKKVCGSDPIAIWLPLKFRLPLVGERSMEWCWRPSLAN